MGANMTTIWGLSPFTAPIALELVEDEDAEQRGDEPNPAREGTQLGAACDLSCSDATTNREGKEQEPGAGVGGRAPCVDPAEAAPMPSLKQQRRI